jgi:integrase
MGRGHISRRGESWRLHVYLGMQNGHRRFATKTIKGSKKDAQEALTTLLYEADRGLIPTDRSTVAEFLHRWLQEYAEPNTQPATYKRYEEFVRLHIIPNIGDKSLQKLAPWHLQNLYTTLKKTHSGQTVLKVHRLLHLALKHARRWQIIQVNVAELVPPPKTEEFIPFVADHKGIQRLLDASEGMFTETLVYLGLVTGLRQGELLGLRWSDIDFDRRVISVRRSAQWLPGRSVAFKAPKTRRSLRTVPITDDTVTKLKSHRARQKEARLVAKRKWSDENPVFSNDKGEPMAPSWVRSQWERLRLKADLPKMRFHDLRHSHATILLQAGANPKVISERLGHSSIGITMDTYGHVLFELQRDAIKDLDSWIKRA